MTLTLSSVSLSTVGMGMIVFMELMLTGRRSTPSFKISGVWVIGTCVGVEVGDIMSATIEQKCINDIVTSSWYYLSTTAAYQ